MHLGLGRRRRSSVSISWFGVGGGGSRRPRLHGNKLTHILIFKLHQNHLICEVSILLKAT